MSSEAGRLIIRAVEASTSSLSQMTSGNSFEILKRDLIPHHHRVALRIARQARASVSASRFASDLFAASTSRLAALLDWRASGVKNYLAFSRSVRRQYLVKVSKNLTPIERR